MSEIYVDIMLQSLRRKQDILDEIIRWNDVQKDILEQPDSEVAVFEQTVEEKSALIDRMEELDEGFDQLYARVKEQLQENKELYKEQIQSLQECIRRITDQGVTIEAQEARNKDLMTQKFARVKKQGRAIRANSTATTEYYRNMMQSNIVEPQFLDNKK